MNSQDIATRKFEKSALGYKPEDVDDYLRDVALALDKAIKEKEENELKIVKLVEKINEYRNDEDAIRDAILNAQKQGNKIIADAKAEAERILAEANARHDAVLAEVQEKSESYKRAETERVAAAIRAENEKLAAVEAAAKTRIELQTDRLKEIKREVTDFKRNLIDMLDKQIKSAIALPELTDEQIENIVNTLPDTTPEVKEESAHQPAPEPAKPEERTEPKAPTAFGFSEFKRQNYSADELKFGQNSKH